MRIVNRETFLALPSGTVYQKYEPCSFGGLAIKGDSLDRDWIDIWTAEQPDFVNSHDTDSFVECCDRMEAGNDEMLQYDTTCRDGLFDNDQWFAIYSPADVRGLITALQGALNNG